MVVLNNLDERYENPMRNDPDGPRRTQRLRELGLVDQPDPRLDALAAELARNAATLVSSSTPDAMVNLFIGGRQYFAGLHIAASGTNAALRRPHATPSREMPYDMGWCPHVVTRQKALVLDDVCAWPGFASNLAARDLEIRSYIGAPLIDHSDIVLGTVCVIARDPRPYGKAGLNFIKDFARQCMTVIEGQTS